MTPQEVSYEARAFERARILALLDDDGLANDVCADALFPLRAVSRYRAALRAAIEKED